MSYSSDEYGEAVRQAMAKAGEVKTQWSGEGAAELAEKLAALPRGQRRQLFRKVPAAAHPEVVEQLLTLARALRGQDLPGAQRLARLAVGCALEAARRFPRPHMAADACAEAWAELANLARIGGTFQASRRNFQRAESALERGTGDKQLLVSVLRRRASLALAERDLKLASDQLRLALRVQADLDDQHEAGKLRLVLGAVRAKAGEVLAAFDENLFALENLNPLRDRLIYFRAVHNSILYMVDLGWHRLALGISDGSYPHYPKFGDDLLTLRGGWVRGRLHAMIGGSSLAERLLDEARRGFAAKNLSYEAALATLDLAFVYAKQRDMRKVAHLVREAYPVFVAKNIPREAAATLLFFADTAKQFGATASAIEVLVKELHALRLH